MKHEEEIHLDMTRILWYIVELLVADLLNTKILTVREKELLRSFEKKEFKPILEEVRNVNYVP